MSKKLYFYLIDSYIGHSATLSDREKKPVAIQIDDQDDNDILDDFCNLFVTVGKKNDFELEICGNFPLTQELQDLVEIYDGVVDPVKGRILLHFTITQIEAVRDLAEKIRNSAFLGETVSNPSWDRVSARTISSLHRFIRVIKEYSRERSTGLS